MDLQINSMLKWNFSIAINFVLFIPLSDLTYCLAGYNYAKSL